MTTYRIAVLPGEGIGREVMPPTVELLDAVALKTGGFRLSYQEFRWGCEWYRRTDTMMPDDALDQLREFDAILLGAVGAPDVPDRVSLWGMLIPIRRAFDQYVNLRPIRLLPGIESPLSGRTADDIDFIIVRENTEGEYSQIGGRLFEGTSRELVVQESVFTKHGVDRVLRFAFELAMERMAGHVTSAAKSNGIVHTMPFWDDRFAEMASRYPDVRTDQFHIDILAAHFVQHPDWFDVVVASNLFGDILSDLGPAIAGSIGIAPSANLDPERINPSMFESVHGSAPDIVGMGLANPIAMVWSAAMMLDWLGETKAAECLIGSIEHATASRVVTPDLGGQATTHDVVETMPSFLERDEEDDR